jgi:hypothetical protein
MGANDDPEHYFLFVGRLKSGQSKLYVAKGSPDDPSCPLWRETSKRMLKGDNEHEVREAAIARARELFDSAEDLSNKSKVYKFDINLARAAKEGPTQRFIVDPWAKRFVTRSFSPSSGAKRRIPRDCFGASSCWRMLAMFSVCEP